MQVLSFMGNVLSCTLGILFFPYLLLLLLLWSPVAWILNLIFPGREFYPLNRAWPVINSWVKSRIGFDLNTILVIILLIMTLGAAISWVTGLFTGKK